MSRFWSDARMLLRFNPTLGCRLNVPDSACANVVVANSNDRHRVVNFFVLIKVLLLFDTMICFFGQAERNLCKQLASL